MTLNQWGVDFEISKLVHVRTCNSKSNASYTVLGIDWSIIIQMDKVLLQAITKAIIPNKK